MLAFERDIMKLTENEPPRYGDNEQAKTIRGRYYFRTATHVEAHLPVKAPHAEGQRTHQEKEKNKGCPKAQFYGDVHNFRASQLRQKEPQHLAFRATNKELAHRPNSSPQFHWRHTRARTHEV